jgi:hypothetical protein
MKTIVALCFLLCAGQQAAKPLPPLYTAVEVDRFVGQPGVAFPTDYQSALAEEIARQISLRFQTVIIVRQGDAVPEGHALLRISGVVTRFQPGSREKRFLIGFGAGATVVEAQVWFTDGTTGRVVLGRQVKGTTWMGVGGGDSQSAGTSLARKIEKICNTEHLVESN